MASLNPTAIALADGQLPNTKTTLYTNGEAAGTKVVIPPHGLTLVNTHSAALAINIYVDRSGTSRRIAPKDYALQAGNDGYWDNPGPIVLEVGDELEGDAGTAALVDYHVSGYREDPI